LLLLVMCGFELLIVCWHRWCAQPDPDNVGKKIKDYWEAAQKTLLTDANKLLSNLKTYDKDNIGDEIIQEVEPFMSMPEFTPDVRARVVYVQTCCSSVCVCAHAAGCGQGVQGLLRHLHVGARHVQVLHSRAASGAEEEEAG
jgi:hypothetical protein